ncbi:Lsr2 dimerization domain-containing protein [Nocardia vaccinii]|uniref:Lsr2 dimerization domain-containing protein n=1 Tax=Nocardia vaccinii TaxID=1822 RepID=UPI00082DA3F2|nr:histone-like nucleoid-structuring protein Lsr2 [Nocardia vaccinii]
MKAVNVELIDDRDGVSVASETVVFGIDGDIYEIDLTDKNAVELRELLGLWALYARRIQPPAFVRKPRPRYVYAVGPRGSRSARTQ